MKKRVTKKKFLKIQQRETKKKYEKRVLMCSDAEEKTQNHTGECKW